MNSRVEIMGCLVDNLSMIETLDKVESLVRSGESHQHVVVNVDKVVKASRNKLLQKIINDCALVNADGMPVVWASRLLRKPLNARVTGIDLFEAIVERAAARGWRVFFLGAREDVVKSLVGHYEQKFPELIVAGYRNGYWKAGEETLVAQEIGSSRPDLLFVAISSPKKEEFLARHQLAMKIPFAMGVGGSFDVITGKTKRAPKWMQENGLEWFYRFQQEPRRMFRRYFIDGMYFFWLLGKEMLRNLTRRPPVNVTPT